MTELISELERGASFLRKASFNPVSLSAGADLFLRFVTLQRPSAHQSFSVHKRNLVARANDFVNDSHKCVEKIVALATGMIKDDAVSWGPFIITNVNGTNVSNHDRSSLHIPTPE
jgi:translation initiation factor eIF-2B subunit alpha